MAERITHRAWRDNIDEVLDKVAEGTTFEITIRGQVVAIMSPPERRSAN